MSLEREADGSIAPEDAFALLGNETRIRILQELGRASAPLTFTEARNAVGVRQGGEFNYHLNKLIGHFVEKTDGGYSLRSPGRRVIEAVYSGAVTEAPVLGPAEISYPCRLCGGDILVGFENGRLELYCLQCAGQYGDAETLARADLDAVGWLGGYSLPPAGIERRDPLEILYTASLWSHVEVFMLANGVCPRCSAVVSREVYVCEEHHPGEDLCGTCENRLAVTVEQACRNCGFEKRGMAISVLIANLELRQFIADHGIDPLAEGVDWGWDYAEEIHAVEPLSATFTFEQEHEAISLTVDDQLDVVETRRHQPAPQGAH